MLKKRKISAELSLPSNLLQGSFYCMCRACVRVPLHLCLIYWCVKFNMSIWYSCIYLSSACMYACSSPLKQGFCAMMSPIEWKIQAHAHTLLSFVVLSSCLFIFLLLLCAFVHCLYICSAQPTICYSFLVCIRLKANYSTLWNGTIKIYATFPLVIFWVCFFSCILRCTHLWNFLLLSILFLCDSISSSKSSWFSQGQYSLSLLDDGMMRITPQCVSAIDK